MRKWNLALAYEPKIAAVRDVLMSKNKIPKEGIEAQIIRW